MSGWGFFLSTMSPAKICIRSNRSVPMRVFTKFVTALSFDVEHTACHSRARFGSDQGSVTLHVAVGSRFA